MRPYLILPLLGLAAFTAPARAGALDSLYDTTLGRLSLLGAPRETPQRPVVNEAAEREQEGRNLRREYWAREKARLEQDRLARARGVGPAVAEVASVTPR